MTEGPRICATVTARTMADLVRVRDKATDADMVEMRLDTVSDPDVAAALDHRHLPVIVTCRRQAEGGHFSGSEQERRALLLQALDAGAEFVDLEWQAGFDHVVRARRGRNVVLSHHDFAGVPADLASRVDAMLATGAEVVKVAVTASRLSDCLTLLELGRTRRDRRLIVLAMGEAGLVTRVFAARFGSCWTYAGEGVAPGQIGAAQLTNELAFRRIGPATRAYGLFGRGIAHSPSPAMHNAGFSELAVDAAYVPLVGADAEDVMTFARGFDLAGASVTIPFKVDLLSRLDDVDPGARAIGAVNTLTATNGGWSGSSTDGAGFLAGLPAGVSPASRAAILGTGGAARAVAAALRDAGAKVTMFGRSAEAAGSVAADLGVRGAARPVPPSSWDLLVNATPVGTSPDVDRTSFPEGTFDGGTVYDLVYYPEQTRLLRDAAQAGCRTVGGLTMLIEQARLQQARWTGRTPSVATLRTAAALALARRMEQS
ncbi:MAG: type I 3-dehydroquinate dehydratase [Acidobacteria bacterium]|nr:type I 3-dehydroquinate dehydratase [Acidobacteriota bacterium]